MLVLLFVLVMLQAQLHQVSGLVGKLSVCKQHHVVSEDGHRICVWEKGPTDSPYCIVLLHGRSFSARPVYDLIFSTSTESGGEMVNLSVMDALAECNIRSFAVDLRGFGGTERDSTGFLSPYRAVEDLRHVLRWIHEIGAGKPSVLGWSQGGLVAHLLGQVCGDMVSSLVLYASIFDPVKVYPRQPFLSKSAEAPRRRTTAEATLEDFTLPGTISDEAAYAFSAAALAADPIKPDWTNLHEFNDIAPFKLDVPTLVIHGDSDPYLAPGTQIHLFSGISACDKAYVIIPNADHCAHLISSRSAFIHHVSSFLKRPTHHDR